MFTNSEIKIENLPKAEAVSLNPISKSYLYIISINIAIQYSVLFGLLILAHVFIKKEWVSSAFYYAITVLLLLFVFQCVISYLSFKKRGYALRTQDIIYAKGWLNHQRTTVPFIRIQHLETKQSFIAKKLKLASLYVYTAGESGGDLSISGLPIDEAINIHSLLTSKINEHV
ncbi:PH domain-containing protein [Lacinutrix neustonica]|uniref:PH domain-containing protein n=1 Tax=Lacinutrix neustonica TaxID=2980107 RepID=A0A9E8MYE3_9FLAO|nr:PH domain-containing protein [Lacinutrix neustonica]WAC02802.1 PH domain-containing protein [Lacinutrix neustonica]